MDVKVMAESGAQFVALGIVGAVVSWFTFWIKEAMSRQDAYRKFRRNPFAKVGAHLHEWRDAGNRQVIDDCTIESIKVGRVVLQSRTGVLVLTIQEFQAGHAVWVLSKSQGA